MAALKNMERWFDIFGLTGNCVDTFNENAKFIVNLALLLLFRNDCSPICRVLNVAMSGLCCYELTVTSVPSLPDNAGMFECGPFGSAFYTNVMLVEGVKAVTILIRHTYNYMPIRRHSKLLI